MRGTLCSAMYCSGSKTPRAPRSTPRLSAARHGSNRMQRRASKTEKEMFVMKKDTKTTVKKAAAKAETAVKSTAAKAETAAKKATEKKPAARKTAPKAPVVNTVLQFNGKELSVAEMVEQAKANWTGSAVKAVNLYIKPEDNRVYVVINGEEAGSIEL